jgi:2-dehydro-3-deoxy-D-arabinonate dehydratase
MTPPLKVYHSTSGLVVENDGQCRVVPASLDFDRLFSAAEPAQVLWAAYAAGREVARPETVLAPIGRQEVWAAGVTYQRSRTARVAESEDAGGAVFYDKVYEAARPELFFKASPHRVAASGGKVCIRADSQWNVPEPELTLAINASGRIFGYTIGNDMSSRDIEAENPLYLPQAKVYDRSAALGPCLWVSDVAPSPATEIRLRIRRGGVAVFEGTTTLDRMKRSLAEIATYLFRSNSFPLGCYLITGTGIVPPDEFSLQVDDVVEISIDPIGTLVNTVSLAS